MSRTQPPSSRRLRMAAVAAALTLLGAGAIRPVGAAPLGAITTVAGGRTAEVPGGAFAQLAQPRTAAVDEAGDIYFTDTYHHQIRRLDRRGVVTTVAGTGYRGYGGDGGPATKAALDTPHGVAVDNRGHVYIADSPNHRIRVVDLATGIIRTVAGNGQEAYGGDGGPATAARLNRPRFLLVAPDGSLIVADTGNYRVRRIDPAGIITTIAGNGVAGYSGDGGPATTARLNEPRSLAIWQSTLYIADSLNDRIRAVDLRTGIITTVAGTGTAGFGGDGGSATGAKINEPRGVAVPPGGDLVVADTNNDRLRYIDLDGFGPVPGSDSGSESGTGGAPVGPLAAAGTNSGSGSGGYRLVAADGGIFSFGVAGFFGSPAQTPTRPVQAIGLTPSPTGRGYQIATVDGLVLPFGDVSFLGSASGVPLALPIVGIAR